MKCPPRLQRLLSWVPKDSVLIDVGCDHGYLGIYALQHQIVSRVIAIDRNPKPLALAQKNAREYGVEEGMTCIHANGLRDISIPDHSVVVCAGMGGHLIKDILEESALHRLRGVIVQPNRDAQLVRNYLASQDWGVVQSAVFSTQKKHFLSWWSQPKIGHKEKTSWHWQDPYLVMHPTQEWRDMLKARCTHIAQLKKIFVDISTNLHREEDVLKQII